MQNLSRCLIVGLTATAMFNCSSAAEPVDADTSSATAAVLAAARIVDPDQQITEARASQALNNGTWAGAPDPGSKAKSPPADLVTYPKLTDKAKRGTQEHTAASEEARTVQTIETLPDGSTGITVYDPAPGFTAEKLADLLRAKVKSGVQVVTRESDAPGALGADDCANGHARSIQCPVVFWANNGYNNPLVRFNDHSGSNWPVNNAVYKWNQVPNIDSAYYWNACPPQGGAHCVDVYSGNYGPNNGYKGRFFYAVSGRFIADGSAWIQLNEYYFPNPNVSYNAATTHEVGHALGLGHNTWYQDVMYDSGSNTEDIGGENKWLLISIYSVNR